MSKKTFTFPFPSVHDFTSDVVLHICNPRTQEAKTRELEASLGYTVRPCLQSPKWGHSFKKKSSRF
ncbi:hypothetical protein I79_002633 [Cricetulus griseus]|uniref:Uncharacterized protein n=1 Tax=Cricetulus griseus TaxID=10029 RepID=G3GXY8_CRIGR|nr:hypothetical protein I79_002633 [Cricetulus griseus]